jgi:threonine/homoserine/homoserine lactone efflux protein
MNEIVRNIFLGLSLAAPLGPSSVAVIQNGLKWGFQRALMTGIGVTLADTTYLLVVFFGLSGFMGIRW